MKKIFMKAVSCLLAIAILASPTTVASFSVFIVSATENSSADSRTEEESRKDAKSSIKIVTGSWGKAKKDGLVPPYSYFHEEVQEYIIKNKDKEGLTSEQYVTFYPDKIPSDHKTDKGRVDLYMEMSCEEDKNEKIAFFWEVKPGSYMAPDKMIDGLVQLDAYVTDTFMRDEVVEHRFGNIPYRDEISQYLEGTIGLSDIFDEFSDRLGKADLSEYEGLDISFDCILDSSKKYYILIAYLPSGLILYWFNRIPNKDINNDPSIQPDYSKFYWLFGAQLLHLLDELNKNRGDGTSLVPGSSIVPSYTFADPDLAFSNKKNETKHNSWEKIRGELELGIAAIVAIRYSVPKLQELLRRAQELKLACEKGADESASLAEMAAILTPCCTGLEMVLLNADNTEYVEINGSSEFHSLLSDMLAITDPEDADAIYYYLYEAEEEAFTDDIKAESSNFEKAGKATPPRDPLIIHFASTDEIEFTSLDEGVNFDLDANGFAEKTAWTKNADGFLAVDRNQDGVINNGSELFGDKTIMNNGEIASTGFEALSSYDRDGNGRIDKNDPIFKELLIWFDVDNKGYTDAGELEPIEKQDVLYIDLNYFRDDYKVDAIGEEKENKTKKEETSYVFFIDENVKKISEFWFPVNSSDTTHDGEVTVGNVPSIEQAIKEDETGDLLTLCLLFSDEKDIARKRYYLKQILYFVTDSAGIETNSRGGNIDARDLHVIETFMGREFEGINGANPNINAANILCDIYSNIEIIYYNYLNLKMSFGGYSTTIYEYTDKSGNNVLDRSLIDCVIESMIDDKDAYLDVLFYDLGVYLKLYDKKNGTNEFAEYCNYYSKIYQSFSDIVELTKNTNLFIGSENGDKYTGASHINLIFGEDGDDSLYGLNGNDHIYGGYGNDILNGGQGDDNYHVELFHENDVIFDTNGDNKVVFDYYYHLDDYDISISEYGEFILTNNHTDETIALPDFLTNPINYDFVFDGEAQTLGGGDSREVIEGTAENNYLESGDGFNVFYGGGGNDTLAGGANMDFLYGEDGADTLLGRNGVNALFGGTGNDMIYDGDDGSYLNGGDEDDSLYGGGGADILDGGAGNDYLQADHGNDTYVFGKGYDTDTINAASDLNTVIIHGYRSTDMINTRNAHNDLIINFKNSDDCLIIDHFFDYNTNRDFNFVFDDGTVLGQYDITAKYAPIEGADDDEWLAIQNSDDGIIHGNGGNDGVSGGSGNDELYGDSGDDTLYGNDGNDILDGGTGTDGLNGGNGTDTYIFAKGYGSDTVNEWGSDHSVIKLSDIDSDEVTVTDQYGSNLLLSVVDTEDTLVISNFKWGQATYTFEFADGAVATVNKDIWTFEFSQLPVVPEEEIPTSDNETTSFDTGSLETDTVDDQTENTSIQNSSKSTVEKVYEETLSTEVSYEPEETVATTITESSTTESDTEVGTGQDEIYETVFTETISSDDSIASSETELSNDLDVN